MDLWIQLVVMGIVVILMGIVVVFTLITGSSPMPTRRSVRRRVLELLPAGLKGTIYDLGSGWGTLVSPLAREFPECRVIGFERSPLPCFFSQFRAWLAGRPNLEIRRRDFFSASLGDAAVVICYLSPETMKRLQSKFEVELAPGALVVSNTFAVPAWTPEAVHMVPGVLSTPVYVYRIR